MPDVIGTPLFASPGNVEYKGAEPKYDDAGNQFSAISALLKVDNNNTWIDVRKMSPAGVLLGSWRLLCTGVKTVGSPGIANDGTTLVVTSAVYQTPAPSETRISYMMLWKIPGVFVVGSAPPPPTGERIILPNITAGVYERVSATAFERAVIEVEREDDRAD